MFNVMGVVLASILKYIQRFKVCMRCVHWSCGSENGKKFFCLFDNASFKLSNELTGGYLPGTEKVYAKGDIVLNYYP